MFLFTSQVVISPSEEIIPIFLSEVCPKRAASSWIVNAATVAEGSQVWSIMFP